MKNLYKSLNHNGFPSKNADHLCRGTSTSIGFRYETQPVYLSVDDRLRQGTPSWVGTCKSNPQPLSVVGTPPYSTQEISQPNH